MLSLMDDLPDHVLGIVANGVVTGEDYKNVLIPAVDKALEKYDKIRAVYVTGPEFKGYGAAALWDDARVGLAHMTAWERIAIVTDVEWMRMVLPAFSFVMMGHLKLFKGDELEQAKAWVME